MRRQRATVTRLAATFGAAHLCADLNATGTLFPDTTLRLIYEILGPP